MGAVCQPDSYGAHRGRAFLYTFICDCHPANAITYPTIDSYLDDNLLADGHLISYSYVYSIAKPNGDVNTFKHTFANPKRDLTANRHVYGDPLPYRNSVTDEHGAATLSLR
jgi:hypothetical protein